MNIAGRFQFGKLVMGYTSEAICGELSSNGNNNDIVMEAQSMLTCNTASLYRNITGPTEGTALLKIHTIENTSGLAYSSSKLKNNIICEITDQTSNGKNNGMELLLIGWFIRDYRTLRLIVIRARLILSSRPMAIV